MSLWSSKFWEENTDICMDELQKDEVWNKIPLLNTTHNHSLKDGQMVRFQGMIQDMYNPVYYLATYEIHNVITNENIIRSGKYKDSLECAENERVLFDSDASVNQERRPVYCITVPAVNQWAQIKQSGTNSEEQVDVSEPLSNSGIKRCAEDTSEENSSVSGQVDQQKKLCASKVAMETDSSCTVSHLNLPIPNIDAKACIINFYDLEDGKLKMNDVIEAAGFLSFDLASTTSSIDGSEEQLPPPSLVPRLHAVAWRPVSSANPLLTPQVTIDDVMQNAGRLRDELKLVLTPLLLGDTLAAEYLICHLISRVYLRQDVLVLGKFSLNLSNLPSSVPDYTAQLYQFMQNLLEKSHYLPMTLDKMNTTTMVPKKNYESNRLESGMLQLSNKTHLVLDETLLQAGQLNDKGVRNCRALNSIITNQKLEYDFQFYPVAFETDIPVLIFSEGKSILLSDCHLPLEIDPVCLFSINEAFVAAQHYLKEPLMSQLRVYLSLVATADYELSHEVQQIVQEDFVQMRQENPKTSAQDLHSLLVLAKLLSLSKGARCLTKECWETTCEMDRQRKGRLSNASRR